MSDRIERLRTDEVALRWWRRFGRRNIGYLAFVVSLTPSGIALEATGPGGPDRDDGVGSMTLVSMMEM